MTEFWSSLTLLQQIFFVIAVSSSLFLLLQVILGLLGADGLFEQPDIDISTDLDGGDIGDAGNIGFLNVKSVVAFFFVGGWMGFFAASNNYSLIVVMLSSLISGFLALVLSTLLIRKLMGLQSSGNLKLDKAIGQTADVYLKIGPKSSDIGKVNVIVSGRFTELNAITMGDKIFKAGEKVCIIDVDENGNLIVEEAV